MHTDVTAVTIQPNKIVLIEVKDSQALLEPVYGKNITDLLAASPGLQCARSPGPGGVYSSGAFLSSAVSSGNSADLLPSLGFQGNS